MAVLRRIALLAAGTVALAGCAGPIRDDASTTRTRWIEQADAICARVQSQVRALEQPQALDALADYAQRAAALQQQEVSELRALAVPDGDEARIGEMLAEVDKVVAAAIELERLARAGDVTAVRKFLESSRDVDRRATKLAEAYGLRQCGKA